ncbi:hypothetical protein HOG98_06010 [bacterium]|nr:hypothetical protein [bacterium]
MAFSVGRPASPVSVTSPKGDGSSKSGGVKAATPREARASSVAGAGTTGSVSMFPSAKHSKMDIADLLGKFGTDKSGSTKTSQKFFEAPAADTKATGQVFALDNKGMSSDSELIACGSTNLTSDRDYFKTMPPTTGKMAPKAGNGGKTPLMNAVKTEFKALMASVDASPHPIEYEEQTPADGKEIGARPLTPELRENAMKALAKAENNWFKAVEMFQDKDPQILRDIRMLEVDFTSKMNHAIMNDNDNVGESQWVTTMNDCSQEIFGNETGTMFDTNYYTGHSILQQGISVNDTEQVEKLQDKNASQALTKVAKNFFDGAEHGLEGMGEAGFMEMANEAAKGLPADKGVKLIKQHKKAWTNAKTQRDNISSKKTQVVTETKAEIGALEESKEGKSAGELSSIEGRISRLNHLLVNDAQVEMVAMNRLYENELQGAQEKFDIMGAVLTRVDDSMNEALDKIGDDGNSIPMHSEFKAELKADLKLGKADEMKGKIRAKVADGSITKDQGRALLNNTLSEVNNFQSASADSMCSQMDALVYANEPYYSAATINGVVAGVQMNKVHEDSGNLEKAQGKFPVLKEPETWGNSMQENFGDLTKDMVHYQKTPEKFLNRGSKYLFRTAFSAKVGLETKANKGASVPPELKAKVDALTELGTKLQSIRGNSSTSSGKVSESVQVMKDYADTFGFEIPTGMGGAELSDSDVAASLGQQLFEKTQAIMVETTGAIFN